MKHLLITLFLSGLVWSSAQGAESYLVPLLAIIKDDSVSFHITIHRNDYDWNLFEKSNKVAIEKTDFGKFKALTQSSAKIVYLTEILSPKPVKSDFEKVDFYPSIYIACTDTISTKDIQSVIMVGEKNCFPYNSVSDYYFENIIWISKAKYGIVKTQEPYFVSFGVTEEDSEYTLVVVCASFDKTFTEINFKSLFFEYIRNMDSEDIFKIHNTSDVFISKDFFY